MPYPELDIMFAATDGGIYVVMYFADNGNLIPYPDEGLPSDCTWIPPVPNRWDY